MHSLYPRRRSLGQRLVNATRTGVAFTIFFLPAWLLDREDRKTAALRAGAR